MSLKLSQEHNRNARPSPVPLLDVTRGNQPLRDEILGAVSRVLDSGQYVLGPDCEQFEHAVAELCQTKFAVGCASGSDALLLALMALDVGPGDEVIAPSFTFFATASAVWRLGGHPVFVDIDPITFTVDPLDLESAVTPNTKVILPVHMFGQCADMSSIQNIARRKGISVVEDVAQAIGASYQGQPAGSLGDIGCISFYPTKNLGGFGDGGMLTTSDEEIASRLRLLRGHGMHPRYFHQAVGINSRLDSIQAAALNVKLPHLPQWNTLRQKNADRYTDLLTTAGLHCRLILPKAATDNNHVWNQYTVRMVNGQRDHLRNFLATQGIGTEIYYPIPLHRQECFRNIASLSRDLPETELAADEVLSLPIFPEITASEQELVVAAISQFYAQYGDAPSTTSNPSVVADATLRRTRSA